MVISAAKRDLSVKGRKFRNEGRMLGIIKRKDGTELPISMRRGEFDKYYNRFGMKGNLIVEIDGEQVYVKIIKVQKDVVLHYSHHVELIEC